MVSCSPELLEQIPSHELIGTVAANGTHDTRACHDIIAAREVTDILPTQWPPLEGHYIGSPGAQQDPESKPPLWSGDLAQLERLPAATSHRGQDAMLDAPWAKRLMAHTSDRQTAELQIRAALRNRFTQLGTPETTRTP